MFWSLNFYILNTANIEALWMSTKLILLQFNFYQKENLSYKVWLFEDAKRAEMESIELLGGLIQIQRLKMQTMKFVTSYQKTRDASRRTMDKLYRKATLWLIA